MKWWTLLQVYKLKARLAYIQHSTKSTLSTEQRYQGKYGILIWWWSGFSFLNLQWQIISTNKSEMIRCNVSWRKLSDLSHSFVPFFFHHSLDESNQWTMIFTGIQALARHFGSRSSIVWACVLWSRSPNISVYLALFIVSSMPNHLVVPSADKCIHPHAVLNISLSLSV